MATRIHVRRRPTLPPVNTTEAPAEKSTSSPVPVSVEQSSPESDSTPDTSSSRSSASGTHEQSEDFERTSPPTIHLFGLRGTILGRIKNLLYGVAVTSRGDLLVNDYSDKGELRTYNLHGIPRRVFRMTGFKTAFRPKFSAVAKNGDIFTTDCGNKQVVVCGAAGRVIRCFGEGRFVNPIGIALSPSDEKVYVVDNGSHCVRICDPEGNLIDSFGRDRLSFPWCACVDGVTGNVIVSDRGNKRVAVFTESGEFLYAFGPTHSNGCWCFDPTGIAIDRTGTVYVCSYRGNRLLTFDIIGNFLGCVDYDRDGVVRPVGICVVGSRHTRKVIVTSWDAACSV